MMLGYQTQAWKKKPIMTHRGNFGHQNTSKSVSGTRKVLLMLMHVMVHGGYVGVWMYLEKKDHDLCS